MLNPTLAMNALNFSPNSLIEPTGPLVWVFEQPLTTALALLIAGIVGATLLRRRGQVKPGFIVGGVMLALAIGAFALGTLIVTGRERIEIGSNEFVVAAVDGDLAALDRLILEEAGLAASGMTVDHAGRERIESLSQKQSDAGMIESWRLSRLQASIDGPNVGTTQFRVRATPRGGAPTLSWWRLHWRRDAQGVWRIGTIDCLAINGQEPGRGLIQMLSGGF